MIPAALEQLEPTEPEQSDDEVLAETTKLAQDILRFLSRREPSPIRGARGLAVAVAGLYSGPGMGPNALEDFFEVVRDFREAYIRRDATKVRS